MSLDFFSTYVTDEKKEIEGAKCPLPNEAFLLIARANNRKYAEELEQVFEANREALAKAGPAADKKSEELLIGVMARTILLGWGGFTWKGKVFEYNEKNAIKALGSKDFRLKVSEFATNIDNYRFDAEEAAAKN